MSNSDCIVANTLLLSFALVVQEMISKEITIRQISGELWYPFLAKKQCTTSSDLLKPKKEYYK